MTQKYTRSKPNGKATPDWVSFKVGVSGKTIAQCTAIWMDVDELAKWIDACHFENDAGTFEAIGEGAVGVSLTPLQLDFVRESFNAWTRDEALDPEA